MPQVAAALLVGQSIASLGGGERVVVDAEAVVEHRSRPRDDGQADSLTALSRVGAWRRRASLRRVRARARAVRRGRRRPRARGLLLVASMRPRLLDQRVGRVQLSPNRVHRELRELSASGSSLSAPLLRASSHVSPRQHVPSCVVPHDRRGDRGQPRAVELAPARRSPSANSCSASRRVGAAAAWPSTNNAAQPSSRRSAALPRTRCRRGRLHGARHVSRTAASARKASGEHGRGKRFEVALAGELRRRTARSAWRARAATPGPRRPARCKRDLGAQQVHARALELVERPGLRRAQRAGEPRRTRRPGGSPAPRPARAPPAAPGPRSARRRAAGTPPRPPVPRAPAPGRPSARAPARPPRRVPPPPQPDATRDGRDRPPRSVTSANARWTARRSCDRR